MARRGANDITLMNVQIRKSNFAGKEGPMNNAGQRNFLALLDDEVGREMEERGLNVKYLKPLDDQDNPKPFLKVKVNFNSDPQPYIVMVTSGGQTQLDADTVGILDGNEIITSDIVVARFQFENNNPTVYLNRGYFTIYEDELDLKYAKQRRLSQQGIDPLPDPVYASEDEVF